MTKRSRILLVDDEPTLIQTVAMRLRSEGYEVITALNGEEGFRKARMESPNLIILDLMLPKMDGYKVCGLLKRDTRYSRIPIILFTARAHETDIQLGEEAGADAYIQKPFEAKSLVEKIGELLRKT
jgi:DNA-binding response OmpR family regulator